MLQYIPVLQIKYFTKECMSASPLFVFIKLLVLHQWFSKHGVLKHRCSSLFSSWSSLISFCDSGRSIICFTSGKHQPVNYSKWRVAYDGFITFKLLNRSPFKILFLSSSVTLRWASGPDCVKLTFPLLLKNTSNIPQTSISRYLSPSSAWSKG